MGFFQTFGRGVKIATHVIAGIAVGAIAFAATPAGTALIKQYPVVSGAIAGLGVIVAAYHQPAKD